jgi:hypothetical protein
VFPAEQQGHIHGYAGEDRFFDGGQPLLGAWYLDEEVGAFCPCMQLLGSCDCAGRVVREKWRDLERDPAVYSVGAVPGRAEQVCCLCQIFDCKLEEQALTRLSFLELAADR